MHCCVFSPADRQRYILDRPNFESRAPVAAHLHQRHDHVAVDEAAVGAYQPVLRLVCPAAKYVADEQSTE